MDEDSQVIKGNTDEVYCEAIEFDDGRLYNSPIFKFYIKEDYNKMLLNVEEKAERNYSKV